MSGNFTSAYSQILPLVEAERGLAEQRERSGQVAQLVDVGRRLDQVD
jgi:hypothetical protein